MNHSNPNCCQLFHFSVYSLGGDFFSGFPLRNARRAVIIIPILFFSFLLTIFTDDLAHSSPLQEGDQDSCLALFQGSPPPADAGPEFFLRCAGMAQRDNAPQNAASAYVMAATRLAGQDSAREEAENALQLAAAQARQCDEQKITADLLIETGLVFVKVFPKKSSSHVLTALNIFQEASQLAESNADQRQLSIALGYMAEIYESENRYEEALQLSRRAVFSAQEAQDSRLLFQWHWLTGRLLVRQQDNEGALDAFRLAIAESRAMRDRMKGHCENPTGFPSASRPVSALYNDMVDLLLKKAALLPRQQKEYTGCLREARENIELLKASELRDYFRDDCLVALQSQKTDIDSIASRTAIIYPVILTDRIEMLTSINGVMNSYRIDAPVPEIMAEVNKFRALLETRTSSEYLRPAQYLYDKLIRPMEEELRAAAVDTLVFVPSGVFRTIPFDALHDGKEFLVEKYATAVTPGLDLTAPRPLSQGSIMALAAGLTEPVQGFPPLPYVGQELQGFHTLFGGRELINEGFNMAALEKTLREEPVGIIHIASHGQFGHDLSDTFLLTYDQKLTIDQLNDFVGMFRFRQTPLELLTLSACQTASGDDQAALGLAGVAVRAGARSAVATLWYINDEASSKMIDTFYHKLKENGTSKANALRQAKLALMEERRYRHPAYWSPFLMINNWL